MTTVAFTVPGGIVSWSRTGTKGGQRFTPKRQRSFSTEVKDRALTAMAGRPLLSGPLALTVTAVWPWPASLSSKKRALPGAEWRTSRPDWDNTGKLVSDSLNLIVWNDDAQVVQATVLKRYGESPGLTVEVRALAPV